MCTGLVSQQLSRYSDVLASAYDVEVVRLTRFPSLIQVQAHWGRRLSLQTCIAELGIVWVPDERIPPRCVEYMLAYPALRLIGRLASGAGLGRNFFIWPPVPPVHACDHVHTANRVRQAKDHLSVHFTALLDADI